MMMGNSKLAIKRTKLKGKRGLNLTLFRPPSVYYKNTQSHVGKRLVTDFKYRGNHHDVLHLSSKRLGPTPHIS